MMRKLSEVVASTAPVPSYEESLSARLVQVKFLLSQAPVIQPTLDLLRRSITPFAYIHPKTFDILTTPYRGVSGKDSGNRWVCTISPSPTRFVLTDLMPEGGVIFSPNAIPCFDATRKP